MKEVISTDEAPAAVGAYSQATATDGLVYTAGQVAITPDGRHLDDRSVERQTRQVLDNLESVLGAADCSTRDVLKTTVFLGDIEDYDAVDDVYAEFFDDDPPARSAVAVADLPAGFDVEIEAVATRE
ncbi:reactive intermediate/imine deaminase [Halobacteriales archaeon SW_5_70_135]|nr:MAG: reactive intermediate/imine deaminase [Halobacteriales archaeon SW_5_70_135]